MKRTDLKLIVDNTRVKKSSSKETPIIKNSDNQILSTSQEDATEARALLVLASSLLSNAGVEYAKIGNIIDDCSEMLALEILANNLSKANSSNLDQTTPYNINV